MASTQRYQFDNPPFTLSHLAIPNYPLIRMYIVRKGNLIIFLLWVSPKGNPDYKLKVDLADLTSNKIQKHDDLVD